MDIVVLILMSALYINPAVCISTHHVRAVSPRDYYRNGPLPLDKINWETGLKEATYQALLREQVPDPQLKEGVYSAEIEGFQDSATPFGDIAVIARGQLYAASHGYHFVQDPYQNDCDDCHTPHRCDRRQCEPQNHPNLNNLIALWTVKRIRHRDPKYGHRYELQYTISPMSPAASPEFVARNGRFDYNVPGHVFIIKIKENEDENIRNNNNFRFDKEHKSTNHKEFKVLPWGHHINNADIYQNVKASTENHYHQTPNTIVLNTGEYYFPQKDKIPTTTDHVFNPGFLIGISPNGYKHIIHDIPGLVADRPYINDKHYIRPQETTPKEPIKHLHHHFYIPEVTDIDLDKKVVPTILTTTKDQRYHNTYKPVVTTDNIHKFIFTTNNVPETPTSPKQIYTQESTRAQVVPPLTTQGFNFKTTFNYPETTVPITINPTIFGDVKYNTEPNYVDNTNYPKTTVLKVFTVPATSPTHATPFSPSPFYFQYSEPDPIYNNNQPPTVPTYITQTINPTIQPTVPTFVTLQEHPRTATIIDVFDDSGNSQAEYGNTHATTPMSITTPKPQKFPDSINAQLPAPDKGTDTTVPYVASTAVTILSTGAVTESTIRGKDSNESDEKDTESSERKATTIQERTHVTTSTPIFTEDDNTSKYTTVIEAEQKFLKSTTPYIEVSTITTQSEEDSTITTDSATTLRGKIDKGDSDEVFGTVNIPKKNTKPKTIYQEDFDIFGESKQTTQKLPETTKQTTLSTKKRPNAFDEIFSDYKSSTENTNKFIPHTQLSINRTDALRNARISKYLKYKRNKVNKFSLNRYSATTEKQNKTENNTEKIEGRNDGVETKTSQSFITSISFKVNKNNKSISGNNNENTSPKHENQEQRPNLHEFTTTDRSQTFDDVARTLVNHARVASYLNIKSTKPTRKSYKQNSSER